MVFICIYDYLINGNEYVIFAMLLIGYEPTIHSNMKDCSFKAEWINSFYEDTDTEEEYELPDFDDDSEEEEE